MRYTWWLTHWEQHKASENEHTKNTNRKFYYSFLLALIEQNPLYVNLNSWFLCTYYS